MSNAIQITPGFWKLKLGAVNSYLLETEDGLLIIDAGWPNKTAQFYAAVKESGHNLSDIKHLILTHGHIDHAGGAAELVKKTGAKTYAHPKDLELISKGEAERPGTSLTPGLINALIYFFFIKFGGSKYESFYIDQLINDGDVIPLSGGIEVIHAPGHCAGQVVLLLRKTGILVAADLCSNVGSLGYSILNEDIALARQTVLKIASLPFKGAVFGHGDYIEERANEKIKERFSNPELK
jgi:glyoxylase-like metal-dependent hydrolase (beta-lactamase superfamily II)